jgi:MFS family permease
VVGGWLVEEVDWRWVFLINLPLGVVVVLAALRHLPETRDPDAVPGFDILGSVFVTLALAGVTYGLIAADEQGFGSPVVLGPIVVGVAAFAAFVRVERRSPHPMLPLDIFSSRQFTAANLVTFVVYASLGGVFFLLVVVLQTALGYSAIEAGAASLPITALMFVLSARAGALAQRIGPRVPLTLGPLLIAAAMLLMLRIAPGSAYVGDVLPAIIVFGLGLSLVVAPVTATVLAAADERHAGAASGVNNAVARTAQLAAVAILPLAAGLSGAAYRDPQALTDAFHRAMIIAAVLAVAGGVLAWLTISDEVLHADPDDPAPADPEPPRYHCAVDGTPLSPDRTRTPVGA